MDIQPLIEGQYFHIYNRGVNGEDIFKEERSYHLFLERYKFYCNEIMETLSYCLLKNHFHLLVRIKENVEVLRKDGTEGLYRMNAPKQLGHLFNSYAQSINKTHNRTGPLFESPFERKLVDNESYLLSLIYYCHRNPVHHGFVNDLRDWKFSSYRSILKNDTTIVAVDKVLKRFGTIRQFEEAHRDFIVQAGFEKYIIESRQLKQPPSGSATANGALPTRNEGHNRL